MTAGQMKSAHRVFVFIQLRNAMKKKIVCKLPKSVHLGNVYSSIRLMGCNVIAKWTVIVQQTNSVDMEHVSLQTINVNTMPIAIFMNNALKINALAFAWYIMIVKLFRKFVTIKGVYLLQNALLRIMESHV